MARPMASAHADRLAAPVARPIAALPALTTIPPWAGVLAVHQRQAVAQAQQTPMQANHVLQMTLLNLLRQQHKQIRFTRKNA